MYLFVFCTFKLKDAFADSQLLHLHGPFAFPQAVLSDHHAAVASHQGPALSDHHATAASHQDHALLGRHAAISSLLWLCI